MNYWAWGGAYIGFRKDSYLYSRAGKPIGRFVGEEIYDFKGKYVGEIRNKDRLIVDRSKKNNKMQGMVAIPCLSAGTSYCDYAGYCMISGYEDLQA